VSIEHPSSEVLHTPRLAEMVASVLRERIVDGEVGDGEMLPTLDRLVKEFGVSKPSIREALRILENERLITVKRGNVGGAVVHRPEAGAVAYMIGLVLQSDDVGSTDLRAALGELQPVCASLCAQRRDRARKVVPLLRRACDESSAAMDDPAALERWSRTFHNDLIAGCGNQSLVLVVGALERLWAAQSEAWTYRVAYAEESPDPALRREGLAAHIAITDAIEGGDADLAAQLVRGHMRHPKLFRAKGKGAQVRATGPEAQRTLR
jgi:GntR family transcriptional repressor for pyruvate dehydrogenase complex